MASLYIHIPFCVKKCFYCSFNSCVGDYSFISAYVNALQKEIFQLAKTTRCKNEQLDTIFIGGGTPTCLPAKDLALILAQCHRVFNVSIGAEISVEANPGTIDTDYLEILLKAGVTRLSLGVQSFDDRMLYKLGRVHNSRQAIQALSDAKQAGFNNINIDLMYGLPGQQPSTWRESLEKILSIKPQHLSLYQLTVEENTPMFNMIESGEVSPPVEEDILLMDEMTLDMCISTGFEQYEISNYCLKGFRCRHNINYWRNTDYYGVGASAVSCIDGCRKKRVQSPREYIEAMRSNRDLVIETEILSCERSFRETVVMGLRMVEGVCVNHLHNKYGMDTVQYYGSTLKRLLDEELVDLSETHLFITKKGWAFSNRIMAELV